MITMYKINMQITGDSLEDHAGGGGVTYSNFNWFKLVPSEFVAFACY